MRANASRLADKLMFAIWVTTIMSQRISRLLVLLPASVTFNMSQLAPVPLCKFVLRAGPGEAIFPPALSDGVMVTQRPLEALFMVRIHVGQPLFNPISLTRRPLRRYLVRLASSNDTRPPPKIGTPIGHFTEFSVREWIVASLLAVFQVGILIPLKLYVTDLCFIPKTH